MSRRTIQCKRAASVGTEPKPESREDYVKSLDWGKLRSFAAALDIRFVGKTRDQLETEVLAVGWS